MWQKSSCCTQWGPIIKFDLHYVKSLTVNPHARAGGRGWLWGGCSDNVNFGETISKQYVDAQETGQDSRAAVNLHNNEAGRQVSTGRSLYSKNLRLFYKH